MTHDTTRKLQRGTTLEVQQSWRVLHIWSSCVMDQRLDEQVISGWQPDAALVEQRNQADYVSIGTRCFSVIFVVSRDLSLLKASLK